MAFSTYSDLVAAIGRWAWRSGGENETEDTVFVAAIPDFIRLLESRVNRTLRVGEMLKTDTVTFTNGVGSLPDDYLQYRRVSEAAHPSVDLLPGAERNGRGFVISGLSVTGWPATIGELTLDYYAAIPPLTSAAPTNWLLAKAPEVYLYGSLLEAMPFTQDDARAATWHAYYDKAIEGLTNADTMARYARSGYRIHGATP